MAEYYWLLLCLNPSQVSPLPSQPHRSSCLIPVNEIFLRQTPDSAPVLLPGGQGEDWVIQHSILLSPRESTAGPALPSILLPEDPAHIQSALTIPKCYDVKLQHSKENEMYVMCSLFLTQNANNVWINGCYAVLKKAECLWLCVQRLAQIQARKKLLSPE